MTMSKGYVKSLAEQISRDGSPSKSQCDNNGLPRNNGTNSGSSSPDDGRDMKSSRVQNMIKAAEYKNEESIGQFPSTKRPSVTTDPKFNGFDRKMSSPEGSRTFYQCLDNNKNNGVANKVASRSPLNRRRSSSPGHSNRLQNKLHLSSPRKQSLGNKPSIPQKPAFLSNLSPRKENLISPSSTPVSTSCQSLSSGDSSPIYAQVNKNNECSRLNGESEKCEKRDPSPVVLRNSGEGGRVRRDSEQYRDSVFNTIYDNASALSAAELFDSSWSDSDSLKDFSDDDGTDSTKKSGDDKSDSINNEDIKSEDKRFKIASELLKTEQDYVAMLHLLHMIFYTRLEKENSQQQLFPSDVLKCIFSNTKSIYLFHHDFLLPQIEARMKDWDNDPRIGDLMKKNAPFLKMYSEYIRNFSNAMKVLKDYLEKSSRFSTIIQEIQKQPVCGNLSLQHHMLGPIQRVPRYELLLKDYVKHLPADSPDMNDAKDALDLVTRAACHSNDAMVKIETFRKLLDIYQSLRGVPVDFISPTREFVMQGPITKISARSGEKQPRYIFLFNDLVLICSQHLLGTYNVKCEMQVDNMEIKPAQNMNISNSFMVRSRQKAVEFLDENNSPEPLEWEQRFQGVIETYKSKKRSLRQDTSDLINKVPDSCLGETAPVWISDDSATMCMLCGTSFNMMRRRHHCRSCGKLVCKSCCNKAPLEYMQGKIERVCTYCYNVIVNNVKKTSPENSVSSTNGTSPKKKGSKKDKASAPCIISSYLQCSEDGGKTWSRLFISAHADYVLYTFRAHEDVSSLSSLPLPGHTVEAQPNTETRSNVFIVKRKGKVLMFQTEDENQRTRWITILAKLIQAKIPDESVRLSSHSNSSNNSSLSDTTTATLGSDQDNRNGHLAPNEENDEKAEVRSQYDNVDP